MRILLPLAILLPLGACAGLTGGDPALYQSLRGATSQLASRTMQSALERASDGSTRWWANEQTGHRGSLTPTRTHVSDSGSFCRRIPRGAGGRGVQSGSFYHAACRDENARWLWL